MFRTYRQFILRLSIFTSVNIFLLGLPALAMEQRIGDFELALDAPWRMEPRAKPLENCGSRCGSGSNYEYGAIPINIAILDAFLPNADVPNSRMLQRALQGMERNDLSLSKIVYDIISPVRSLFGKYPNMNVTNFKSLTVSEELNGQFVSRIKYKINALHEVERTTGFWRWSANSLDPPSRPRWEICRLWAGDDCHRMTSLEFTSEWQAIAMYQPQNKQPGTDVKLKLDLVLATSIGDQSFTQYVNVHLGEAPLPKFDENWYYGDIHYHSQGTDNDGESGYSYRSALQTMSALGLDFAFATDHASNSKQIASVTVSSEYPNIAGLSPNGLLRDLSPDRFAFNINLLNGSNGANREVASYPRKYNSSLVVGRINRVKRQFATPQIFAGAEVDVIPEFEIGKSAHFQFLEACKDLPANIKSAELGGTSKALRDGLLDAIGIPNDNEDICRGDNLVDATNDGRYLIRDPQGPHGGHLVSRNFYGRQHLLHLPEDPHNETAFISSDTSKYGGATRRLKDILATEFRQPNGVIFLAHPLSTPAGSDVGRLGPDIAPYATAPLMDAFRSPNVLGLQFWNENAHFKTEMGMGDAVSTRPAQEGIVDPGTNSSNDENLVTKMIKGEMIPVADLANWKHGITKKKGFTGLSMWDSMLLWGMDPAYTSSINWLAKGEPRRIFMAGGSDAHGDYNYKRDGYLVGITAINDGAIGTPRNLIFAGSPKGNPIQSGTATGTPVSQAQMVQAFRKGQFIVTDGPIFRLAYDKNKNGRIDAGDIPMGGVATVSHCNFQLLVEWKSTPEFGPVQTIDLTLGVFSDKYSDGWIYQRWRPPVRFPNKKPSDFYFKTWSEAATGRSYSRAELSSPIGWRGKLRTHMFDPTENSIMAINIPASKGYGGIKTIRIEPARFPVAKLTTKSCSSSRRSRGRNGAGSRPALTAAASSEVFANSNESRTGGPQTTNFRTPRVPRRPGLGDPDPIVADPGDRNPSCTINNFSEPARPNRMFIRAQLNGVLNGQLQRKAYANPIWFNIVRSRTQICLPKPPVENAPPVNAPPTAGLRCSKASKLICRRHRAKCEVLKDRKNVAKDVCRWSRQFHPANKCRTAGGIWTTAISRYAKNHPRAVKAGARAACLSEVNNLR